MSKPLKELPVFKTEAEETAFWQSHDSTDYVDWTQAHKVRLSNLKPSTKTISLRHYLAQIPTFMPK